MVLGSEFSISYPAPYTDPAAHNIHTYIFLVLLVAAVVLAVLLWAFVVRRQVASHDRPLMFFMTSFVIVAVVVFAGSLLSTIFVPNGYRQTSWETIRKELSQAGIVGIAPAGDGISSYRLPAVFEGCVSSSHKVVFKEGGSSEWTPGMVSISKDGDLRHYEAGQMCHVTISPIVSPVKADSTVPAPAPPSRL